MPTTHRRLREQCLEQLKSGRMQVVLDASGDFELKRVDRVLAFHVPEISPDRNTAITDILLEDWASDNVWLSSFGITPQSVPDLVSVQEKRCATLTHALQRARGWIPTGGHLNLVRQLGETTGGQELLAVALHMFETSHNAESLVSRTDLLRLEAKEKQGPRRDGRKRRGRTRRKR